MNKPEDRVKVMVKAVVSGEGDVKTYALHEDLSRRAAEALLKRLEKQKGDVLKDAWIA